MGIGVVWEKLMKRIKEMRDTKRRRKALRMLWEPSGFERRRIKRDKKATRILLRQNPAAFPREFLPYVTKHETLERIMREDENYYTRLSAACYLYNVEAPGHYGENDSWYRYTWHTQAYFMIKAPDLMALKVMDVTGDPSLMLDIAKHSRQPDIKMSALNAIPDLDPAIRREIHSDIREMLVGNAKYALYQLRIRIARTSDWEYRPFIHSKDGREFVEPCKLAIRMMSKPDPEEQRILADIAMLEATGIKQLRILAAGRLTDPALLKEVFEASGPSETKRPVNNETVRRIALNHIYDIGYLREFAESDPLDIVTRRIEVLEALGL
jgi:hypothetical protein